MRHCKRHTFTTEAERAADYRARVGEPLPKTTVYPEPRESIEEWAEKVKALFRTRPNKP